MENENINFTCFECLLIPRYYFKFKDKKTYICTSCYCSHESVLELYEFKEKIKKTKKIPKCSRCPNEMISKNSFYFCFQCGKYFCPNHQKHHDLLNNIIHERIVKLKNVEKICPYHFNNFNNYCDNCQSPVCDKCECIANTSTNHKLYKNLSQEDLNHYKEYLQINQQKYMNMVNYIKEKNEIFKDLQLKKFLNDFVKNNNDIYEFLNLLIDNYEKNNNPIMSYNIQTTFIFNDLQSKLNYIEKISYIKFLLNPFNNFIRGVSDNISQYEFINENLDKNDNTSEKININNSYEKIIQKTQE